MQSSRERKIAFAANDSGQEKPGQEHSQERERLRVRIRQVEHRERSRKKESGERERDRTRKVALWWTAKGELFAQGFHDQGNHDGEGQERLLQESRGES